VRRATVVGILELARVAVRLAAAARGASVNPDEVLARMPPEARERLERMEAIVNKAKAGELSEIEAARMIAAELGLPDAGDAIVALAQLVDELRKSFSGPGVAAPILD